MMATRASHTFFFDVIGEIQVEFFHSHTYVVRLNTKTRVRAAHGALAQSLAVSGFEWESPEQDYHHQI